MGYTPSAVVGVLPVARQARRRLAPRELRPPRDPRAAARSVAARSSHPSEMSGSSMRTAEPSSEKLESTDRRAVAISPSAPREGKSAMLACDAT